MKVTIPQTQKDITLGQYQEYELLKVNAKTKAEQVDLIVCSFTELDETNINSISQKDKEEIYNSVCNSLDYEGEFESTFILNGIEFGLIPNFKKDNVSGGEYTDMVKYDAKTETLNRLMAILYRPISVKDSLGNYEIEPYENTSKYAETMKGMSLSNVNGVLGFFLRLQSELEICIQQSLKQE